MDPTGLSSGLHTAPQGQGRCPPGYYSGHSWQGFRDPAGQHRALATHPEAVQPLPRPGAGHSAPLGPRPPGGDRRCPVMGPRCPTVSQRPPGLPSVALWGSALWSCHLTERPAGADAHWVLGCRVGGCAGTSQTFSPDPCSPPAPSCPGTGHACAWLMSLRPALPHPTLPGLCCAPRGPGARQSLGPAPHPLVLPHPDAACQANGGAWQWPQDTQHPRRGSPRHPLPASGAGPFRIRGSGAVGCGQGLE